LSFQSEIAETLDAELATWKNAHPVFTAPKAGKPLDKEKEEKLRSLGYLR
jgi:hypothetical protein